MVCVLRLALLTQQLEGGLIHVPTINNVLVNMDHIELPELGSLCERFWSDRHYYCTVGSYGVRSGLIFGQRSEAVCVYTSTN
jgi:hypothetical protein